MTGVSNVAEQDRANDRLLEQKLYAACRSAMENLSPEYLAVLRGLPPGARLQRAFELWRIAKEALVRQELAKGRPKEVALRVAAERMLRREHETTT